MFVYVSIVFMYLHIHGTQCICIHSHTQYILPGIIHLSNQPKLSRGDGPIVSVREAFAALFTFLLDIIIVIICNMCICLSNEVH